MELTDYGYRYVSHRKAEAGKEYVRVYQYVMPAQQIRANLIKIEGGRSNKPKFDGHIWVPVDDEGTMVYNTMYGYDQDVPLEADYLADLESRMGRGPEHFIPGTFKLKQNLSNDYWIDRQDQKTTTFTGIPGVNTQDFALQEGMGAIVDRSKENLGSSDKAIVAMRRQVLRAIEGVANRETPPGVDPATHNNIRPHDEYLPEGADWRVEFAGELQAKW